MLSTLTSNGFNGLRSNLASLAQISFMSPMIGVESVVDLSDHYTMRVEEMQCNTIISEFLNENFLVVNNTRLWFFLG